MDAPKVKPGDWISIQGAVPIEAYVISVLDDGLLSVGYAQSSTKVVKESVIWAQDHWEFEYSGAVGICLHGQEAARILSGPPRKP